MGEPPRQGARSVTRSWKIFACVLAAIVIFAIVRGSSSSHAPQSQSAATSISKELSDSPAFPKPPSGQDPFGPSAGKPGTPPLSVPSAPTSNSPAPAPSAISSDVTPSPSSSPTSASSSSASNPASPSPASYQSKPTYVITPSQDDQTSSDGDASQGTPTTETASQRVAKRLRGGH